MDRDHPYLSTQLRLEGCNRSNEKNISGVKGAIDLRTLARKRRSGTLPPSRGSKTLGQVLDFF
jgi:hypothetical protein